jgi:hypothetical protein
MVLLSCHQKGTTSGVVPYTQLYLLPSCSPAALQLLPTPTINANPKQHLRTTPPGLGTGHALFVCGRPSALPVQP